VILLIKIVLVKSGMPIKVAGQTFREVNRVLVTKNLCDELGHMNIQHYYAALSDGMFSVMALAGMPKEDIPIRRTSFALYKEEAEFFEELKEGDEFYMATALTHIGTKSIVFENRFFSASDDHLLFRAKFISVFMDLDSRASIPIPEKIKASLLMEIPKYIKGD
jgi:acyl-CoA thioester hydrolase